jgi:hypothetical protein
MQLCHPCGPRRLVLALSLIASLPGNTVMAGSNAPKTRQLGKHEHGSGTLNVALDGPILAIELDGPAANYLGFEHQPHNSEEQAALDGATALLRDGPRLFRLPPAAGCRLLAVTVEKPPWPTVTPGGNAADDPEKSQDHEHADEAHADMGGSYEFRCADPAALAVLKVEAFALFPALKELAATVLGPGGQAGATLTPARPSLELRK